MNEVRNQLEADAPAQDYRTGFNAGFASAVGSDPRAQKMVELAEKLKRGEALTPAELAISKSEEYRDAVRSQHRLSLARLREHRNTIAEKQAFIRDAEREMAKNERQQERLRGILKAYDAYAKGPFLLERPTESALHRLVNAIVGAANAVTIPPDVEPTAAQHTPFDGTAFMIEHDWAAAFKGAHEFDEGEFKLPFPQTVFELRISGAPVIVFMKEGVMPLGFLRLMDHWCAFEVGEPMDDGEVESALGKLITSQIRAACIALDAEVAIKETVRATDIPGYDRAQRRGAPLLDYHVIRLAHRERAAPLPADHLRTTGVRHRLHFVRGHWRHYPTHRTWVKWHLRGDPDLGFIDKHYRL